MHDWERKADARLVADAALLETGLWIARLAPFRYFITLTHRPKVPTSTHQAITKRGHRSGSGAYTRVGLVRHNKMVRDWFYDDVKRLAPEARMWSETEEHAKGDPHEHTLIDVPALAPIFTAMQSWYDRPDGGIWNLQPFSADPDELVRAAAYVEKAAKYAGKLACQPPKVLGFGLSRLPSFAQVLAQSTT